MAPPGRSRSRPAVGPSTLRNPRGRRLGSGPPARRGAGGHSLSSCAAAGRRRSARCEACEGLGRAGARRTHLKGWWWGWPERVPEDGALCSCRNGNGRRRRAEASRRPPGCQPHLERLDTAAPTCSAAWPWSGRRRQPRPGGLAPKGPAAAEARKKAAPAAVVGHAARRNWYFGHAAPRNLGRPPIKHNPVAAAHSYIV